MESDSEDGMDSQYEEEIHKGESGLFPPGGMYPFFT